MPRPVLGRAAILWCCEIVSIAFASAVALDLASARLVASGAARCPPACINAREAWRVVGMMCGQRGGVCARARI